MATLTTHTLNSVDGTHAGQVGVSLFRVTPDGTRLTVFEAATDAGGRLTQRIPPADVDSTADYELVFQTGAYFATRGLPLTGLRIQKEVVIRFCMPDPRGGLPHAAGDGAQRLQRLAVQLTHSTAHSLPKETRHVTSIFDYSPCPDQLGHGACRGFCHGGRC